MFRHVPGFIDGPFFLSLTVILETYIYLQILRKKVNINDSDFNKLCSRCSKDRGPALL